MNNLPYRSTLLVIALLSVAIGGCISITTSTPSTGGSTPSPSAGTPSNGQSSNASVAKLYKVYSHKNFESASIFREKINLKQIDYRRLNALLWCMTNKERAKRGKALVPYHERLEVTAFFHSKAMGDRNFFDHINKQDKARREPTDRAKLAGIANPMPAENIVYTSSFKESPTYLDIGYRMMGSWMKSAGHKQNILSEKAKSLGCGVYYRNGNWYGTQVFQHYSNVVNASGTPTDRF